MERKNVCQSPEYTMGDVAEFFESEKTRALRVSEIEAIMGDDYDLDRLRELVEADRDGRCVVLPCRKNIKLLIDGLEYQADHWNITLSLFTEDNATRSGYKVKLLSIKEIEVLLKGDQDG